MSMIFICISHSCQRWLPLSASTDYEQGNRRAGVAESILKMLSKKLAQLPDRCTLKTGHYNISKTSSLLQLELA
uniref:Uncharacterized protein n=1 Tax=Ursus americanus TaxID=9643 RepID=A0A452QF78_URSAM